MASGLTFLMGVKALCVCVLILNCGSSYSATQPPKYTLRAYQLDFPQQPLAQALIKLEMKS